MWILVKDCEEVYKNVTIMVAGRRSDSDTIAFDPNFLTRNVSNAKALYIVPPTT